MKSNLKETQLESNNSFSDYVKIFDYFGIPIQFKFKNNRLYKSQFGGIIFIIFTIFSTSYFLFNFVHFFNRKIYMINPSTKFLSPSPFADFNELEFNFAFSLQYNNNTFLDEEALKLFEFVLTSQTILNSKNRTKTALKYQKCEESNFFNHSMEQFEQLQLSSFNCLDHKPNLSIQGGFSDPIYQFIELSISFNRNLNLTDETVLNQLKDIFDNNQIKFLVYFLDTTLDVENIESPISKYINTYVNYLDFSTIKKTNAYFSILSFSDDKNILFHKPTKKDNLQLGEAHEIFFTTLNRSKMKEDKSLLMKFYIRSSPSMNIITRNYQKLTSFLANMGGLISNLLLILYLIVIFFQRFYGDTTILNEILKYKDHPEYLKNENYINLKQSLKQIDQDSDKRKIFQNQIKIEKEIESNLSNEKENSSISNNLIKINLNQSKNDLGANEKNVCKKSRRPLDFSCIELLLNIFKCKTKSVKLKNEIYLKALNKLNYYMDIFTYIKKMQDIDLLKFLLMNQDQITLFNFISKPSVSLTHGVSDEIYQQYVQRSKEISDKIKKEELESIINSYDKLKDFNDEISNKILKVFNHEIDKLTD